MIARSFPLAAFATWTLAACAHFTPPGARPPATATRPASSKSLHFGILTYTGKWGQGNLDIARFDPGKLDPGQGADAALAAKMKYGVLTTRHHDGPPRPARSRLGMRNA